MNQHNIYLIHGEEPYYARETLESIYSKFPSHTQTLMDSTINYDELFQLCSSASLFSQESLIILTMPSFLFKVPSDKDLKTLNDCISLAKDNHHIIVAMCPGKKVDMRKKASQLFKKHGTVTEHKPLNNWEQDKLFQFMSNYCKKDGVSIDHKAMISLESCAGTSLSILSKCLDTVMLYTHPQKTITEKEVSKLYHGEESSLYQLSEALKVGNLSKLSQCTKSLIKSNEAPVRILATLHNQIKLFYQIRFMQRQKESEAVIAKSLKKHPFFIKTLIRELNRNYTVEKLQSCMIIIKTADLNLKTGRQVATTAINHCIMSLSNTLT